MSATDDKRAVMAWMEGPAGILRLNRPAALNALNPEMVAALRLALASFMEDETVSHVLIEGAGDKAFCAGGDIRFVAASGRAADGKAQAFWRDEYALIDDLASARKPVIALMDGITMGGGAGLGIHVTHRIVTDRTRFAMPETGIGFVPDVGSTWLLARSQGQTGRYMALTGDTFGAADTIHAGLADLHVPAAALEAVRERLVQASAGDIAGILAEHATRPEPGIFAEEEAGISRAFRHDSVGDIMEALANRSAPFAQATLETLRRRSPRSLIVTAELLRRAGQATSLHDCLYHEFRAACRCLASPDYYEGVRAAVIDKDRMPAWESADITAAAASARDGLEPVPGVLDPDFSPISTSLELPAALKAAH